MKVHKEWIGSKKPATQDNLADLQEDIHADLQQFATKQDLKDELKKYATKEDLKQELANYTTKEDLKASEKRLKEGLMSKDTGEELLNYMKSIDRQLKEYRDLPEEVVKLKNRVFKLELRR